MKAEVPVQINGSVILSRLRYRYGPPQIVIFRVAVRDDHVETVDGTALEYRHQHLLFAEGILGLRQSELMQELRGRSHKTKTGQTDTAGFQEKSPVHIDLTNEKPFTRVFVRWFRRG